jgi:hypothetical protein
LLRDWELGVSFLGQLMLLMEKTKEAEAAA